MNEAPADVRPETLALAALIRELTARAETSAGQGRSDRMVFLGNRDASFPAAVIEDPLLEPVDKVVWLVVMLSIREAGRDTSFPGYAAIGKRANIASRSTVARAIAILRATRWLSLCARVPRASGKIYSNVYALHEEPLALDDAQHLDANYLSFLTRATGHAHQRVRTVAQGVLDSLHEKQPAAEYSCRPETLIARRPDSRGIAHDASVRRSFSFRARAVRQPYPDSYPGKESENYPVLNSNMPCNPVQNLCVQISNSSSSSSKYINTTTTTDRASNFVLTGSDGQTLVYPARLCNDHRAVAARYLGELPPEQRQPVLDELEGRFQAEGKGMKPVYDEIRFLHSLCQRVRGGKFQPNLGIKVCEERSHPQQTKAHPRPTPGRPATKESREQCQQRRVVYRDEIAKMRKLLGLKPTTENQ